MIKNQRQYRVTLEQIDLLATAMKQVKAVIRPNVFTEAHITSLETDISALRDDVRQYDSLQGGQFDMASLQHVRHLGRDLIRARIACKLTHKDLAIALGKKEQAIQRLEAKDYSTASLATLTTIVNVIVACSGEGA